MVARNPAVGRGCHALSAGAAVIRAGIAVAGLVALIGLGAWVNSLHAQNKAQGLVIARQAADIATVQARADLARDAALIAQKERARMAIAATKYETIRDAFRKGNFNAPLPDDFRHLVLCLLRGKTAGPDAPDCPGGAR